MSATLPVRVAAFAAVLLLAAACADGGAEEPARQGERTEVRVLLDWFPNPDHVALYTAMDKALFEDEELDVTLTPPSNPADPLKLVAAGQVDLGISYEPEVLMAAEQRLPVTAVGALVPTALNSLMAVNTSPVKSPSDLEGKTLGTAGLPSDDVYFQQIATKYEVDVNSVKKVNVSANLVSSMLSGKVDATIGAYRNIEGVQLADAGKDPMIVPVTEAGVPEYDELVIVANRDKLRDDEGYRDMVKRFMAALGEGVAAAQADEKAAADSIRKVATGYEAETIDKMVAATTPLLSNPRGFGRTDPEKWQEFADWLHTAGMAKEKIDAGPLVTNDYVPTK